MYGSAPSPITRVGSGGSRAPRPLAAHMQPCLGGRRTPWCGGAVPTPRGTAYHGETIFGILEAARGAWGRGRRPPPITVSKAQPHRGYIYIYIYIWERDASGTPRQALGSLTLGSVKVQPIKIVLWPTRGVRRAASTSFDYWSAEPWRRQDATSGHARRPQDLLQAGRRPAWRGGTLTLTYRRKLSSAGVSRGNGAAWGGPPLGR